MGKEAISLPSCHSVRGAGIDAKIMRGILRGRKLDFSTLESNRTPTLNR
jgi:uncharacterized protein (UPF0335 family)